MFQVSGRGAVLVGTIASGRVRVGQKVTVSSPKGATQGKVEGVEVNRTALDSAGAGDEAGLLITPYDAAAVADGITQAPSGDPRDAIVNLTVSSRSSPWWRFW